MRRGRGLRRNGCAPEEQVLVTDTTMRDAHQSLLATRMRSHDIVGIAEVLCPRPAGTPVAGMLGRRDLRRRHAVPHRGPVGAARRSANVRRTSSLQMLLRGSNGVGYTNYPDNVVKYLRRPGGRVRRRPLPRLRLPQLGGEHARLHGCGDAEAGKLVRGRHVLHRRHPRSRPGRNTTSNTTSAWPGSWRRPAPTSSASRTWPAC